MFVKTITLFFFSTTGTIATSLQQAANGVATVDISKDIGPAKYLASGWIYGFPDNGVSIDRSIPDRFVKDVKFQATRAGGAQIPSRGWVAGVKDYVGRFNSTLSNYRTTRNYGGDFILLVHDLWGADGGSIAKFPGDNGDWTEADAFLNRLASDLQANNMLEGLVIDIWNEPDIDLFWKRSWDQFLAYYVRAHKVFRTKLAKTRISGPSMAHSPKKDDTKWAAWLKSVASGQAVPDIYSWHQIGNWEREPDTTMPDFTSMKATQNLPDLPIDINEYAAKDEQNPVNSVYYISQLERHNLRGLRSNWGGGSALHDYLANLVYKANGAYFPNGEWQLYNYYANMTGNRVATTASSDRRFDVFATRTNSSLNVIAGTRTVKAPYDIRISGLKSLGLPADGSVRVDTIRFDWSGDKGQINAPVSLGQSSMKYSSDTLTITMNPPNNYNAYAYRINM